MNSRWPRWAQIESLLLALGFWLAHLYCISRFAGDVWMPLPATGGDTGSHLWPVYVLREYGLPHWDLRPWNPGNFAGEPLLVHYFPFPFILMALASYFMPIGLAFNLGTFLPVALLPPAIWWSTGRVTLALGSTTRAARLAAAIAGTLSLGVLYNDGNTMWGGNFFSVLAGQFAHQYAFVFFFLLTGVMPSVLREPRWTGLAALLFCAVVISHAYVALFIPMLLLGAFLIGNGPILQKLKRLLQVSILGSLLSMWFWWPLLDNSKWTTPYGFTWNFTGYVKELLPSTLAPTVILLLIGLILVCFRRRSQMLAGRSLLFWAPQLLLAIIGYFVFAKLGLVDVRTIPHLHYVAAIVAAMIMAALADPLKERWRWAAVVPILFLPWMQLRMVRQPVEQLKGWVAWNYSGWTKKEAYPSLQSLSRRIQGSFDHPRVAFEHDGQSNIAGTPRVFEMLPYFSGRSVTDGVYMQSTILAPMTFYHQATVSKNPSCPFPNFGCTQADVQRGIDLGRLFAVDTYILRSDLVIKMADQHPDLELIHEAHPWKVYRDRASGIGYASVVSQPPVWIPQAGWHKQFWQWFVGYRPGAPLLGVTPADGRLPQSQPPRDDCTPSVKIQFSSLTLSTNCPGVLHQLRFAYHSTWRTSTGDGIYLLSPGFLGIVPSAEEVTLKFGRSPSWFLASWVSAAAVLGLFFAPLHRRWRRRMAAKDRATIRCVLSISKTLLKHCQEFCSANGSI